jgi:putative DNA primase/helicase
LEEFDRDELSIGAPNGKMIDLRTGETRVSKPTDLIMKSVSVEPSKAPCPRWTRFVEEITDGDRELAEYLQRMAGSWLTASVKDQTLTVWHGSGGNGKGTFISVVQQILGPYATTIPVDSLVTKKSGDIDLGGIAMLCGARLAVAQEGETSRRFNAGLLKTLTGGDRLTGKILYENKFEFKHTHKLVILTNNKPRVDVDGGIRRRMHLVPFTRSFEATKNVNLKEELLEQEGSILQWMIDGCLAWQSDGLGPPSSVMNYTNEYFEEADDIKSWIEQNCIRDARFWTATNELFTDWKMFCDNTRIFAGSQKDLTENLVREGFSKKKNKRGDKRGISGLRLRNSGIIQ